MTAAPEPTPCPVCQAPTPTGPDPRQPIAQPKGAGLYTQISAGRNHTCGVTQNGTADCWGADGRGQSSPRDGEFLQVAAGGAHTCGVKADGSVVCWGSAAVPSPPASQKFAAVSAGNAHSCGLTVASENTHARVACWGAAGTNRTDDWSAGSSSIAAVSSGDNHNCAQWEGWGGSIYCWGSNDAGQRVDARNNITTIAAGGRHTCWILRDGSVVCQGDNTSGQSIVPAPSEGAFDQNPFTYIAITAGRSHTCAIYSDGNAAQTRGAVRCWGSDLEGQSTPPSGVFTAVAAGGAHTCGLRSNGIVACWGDNTYGQAPR